MTDQMIDALVFFTLGGMTATMLTLGLVSLVARRHQTRLYH